MDDTVEKKEFIFTARDSGEGKIIETAGKEQR